MLEIHIDIRWLVALLRDETLEQQRAARRIDLGDEQAVAHRGIGGRAAPLAENAGVARELHDVVHGEEIAGISQLADQRQLLLEQRLHALWHALRPAFAGPGQAQLAQPGIGRGAGGHDFLGILVTQFIEREMTAPGDHHALFQQRLRVEAAQGLQGAQVLFGIGREAGAELLYRRVEADRTQQIGQRFAAGDMHMHIAAGQHRNIELTGDAVELQVAQLFITMQQHCHAEPQALREKPSQCFPLAQQLFRSGRCRRPYHQAVARVEFEITQAEGVLTLGTAPARQRDQRRELRIGAPLWCEQHQRQSVIEAELAANDELQAMFACRHVGLDHPRKRAFVGDRECAVTKLRGTCDQFLGVRGAAQEGEIAEAVEFGVGHRLRTSSCCMNVQYNKKWMLCRALRKCFAMVIRSMIGRTRANPPNAAL